MDKKKISRRSAIKLAGGGLLLARGALGIGGGFLAAAPALAKKYDIGATDKEVKLGQPCPYSGPASFFASIGKINLSYFRMLNEEQGGINGRKINLVSLDDGYSPPKTVEVTRKMVEEDGVLAIYGISGSATSVAVQRYLASKKVPQLFGFSGIPLFGDPKKSPWSVGFLPSYDFEGKACGKFIRANVKDPKVVMMYQNDDFGKSMLAAVKAGLGDAAKSVVKETSYEVTDPTVDAQIIALQATGANVFMIIGTPKHTSQAIRKSADLGWNPLKLILSGTASIPSVLKPAGLDKSIGTVAGKILKDYSDPIWADDAGMKRYGAFMKKYGADLDPNDNLVALGYTVAQTMAHVIKQCGDELTRENVLNQACNLKKLVPDLMIPGVELSTTQQNRFPIHQMRMARFDGQYWKLVGDMINE